MVEIEGNPLKHAAPSPSPSHSSEESGEPRLKARKDRHCPFCNQYFTSSSLGRHLDLYIKPKNPKPPDGVHDVEQIKQLRGGITRRHTKLSSQRRASPPPALATTSQADSPTPPKRPDSLHNDLATTQHSPFYGHTNWQATGVINNLPPRNTSSSSNVGLSRGPRPSITGGADHSKSSLEERENGRAAELALKEVLSSVQAANTRAHRAPLFDFDPLTLNFPALCLCVLPMPSTIFSTTPVPTATSLPITLPGDSSFEALSHELSTRICAWRRNSSAHNVASKDHGDATLGLASLVHVIDAESQPLFDHVKAAYAHWTSLSEPEQRETWHLELLRAFASERTRRQEAEKSLDKAKADFVAQLQARRDAISPTLQYRPTLQMSDETSAELRRSGADDPQDWTYDALLAKWKGAIRGTGTGTGTSASASASTSTTNGAGSDSVFSTRPYALIGQYASRTAARKPSTYAAAAPAPQPAPATPLTPWSGTAASVGSGTALSPRSRPVSEAVAGAQNELSSYEPPRGLLQSMRDVKTMGVLPFGMVGETGEWPARDGGDAGMAVDERGDRKASG